MSAWRWLIAEANTAARMCTRAVLAHDLEAAARWATAYRVLEDLWRGDADDVSERAA